MHQGAARVVESLRGAFWLNAKRARAYMLILATISGLVTTLYIGFSPLPHDPLGKPLGTDFASFWTASKIALTGDPSAVWTVATHRAAQAALFGPKAGYAAFFYPPTFLLVCLPLALAPYLLSLCIWLAATGLAWGLMCRAWLGWSHGWLPILAFPATLLNAGHGQNGFLTAALFGAGALLCDKRPWLAGFFFGALIIKPHLAILVPIFLVLTGNWKSFIAAGLSAALLCLVALVILGLPAWQGFFATSSLARVALEENLVGYAKMQSAFAGARLLGAPLGLAWLSQIIVALVAVVALWRIRPADAPLAKGAALACATLLATPFLLDYDLTLLAIPLAWLFGQGCQKGFLPWERMMLLIGFVLPLVSRSIATSLHVPLAPFVILGLLACIVRRASPKTFAATAQASLVPMLAL